MHNNIEPLSTNCTDGVRFHEKSPAHPNQTVYVLLHGLGNSLDFWVAVAPELAQVSRTIAIDIPGFGRSEPPQGEYTLENISGKIASFLAKRGVDSCTLVAHSLGGIVALGLAGTQPSLIERLVLVDATLISASELLRQPSMALTRPKLGFAVSAQFVGGILPIRKRTAKLIASSAVIRKVGLWPFVKSPASLNQSILARALANNGGPAVMRALRQARSTNVEELMTRVKQPVNLVWGSDDMLIDKSDIARTRTLLTVDRELEIPNCGHWPMIEFPKELSAFITG